MSERAFTLVFLNLGGEMLYVLDQRLYAQKIEVEKGKKIMQDIVSNMFSDRFLDEIFRPQEMCSKKGLRMIFERLAHTSIMRLNETSMDKLYDLMMMAVKYQMALVTRPREILLVTLNHLDSIIQFVSEMPACVQLIENCYKRLFKTYMHMNDFELQFIRHTMLNFFQDVRIKVSIFLREKLQNWDGHFVLFSEGPVAHGCDLPGTITYYDSRGDTLSVYKESKFNPGTRCTPAEKEGSYERNGNRRTQLGLNIFSSNKLTDTIVPSDSGVVTHASNIQSDYEKNVPDPRAKAQLDLLCKLIGRGSMNTSSADFKLNLFNNQEEEFIYSTNYKLESDYDDHSRVVSVDASKRHRDERLSKIANDFSFSQKYDENRPIRRGEREKDRDYDRRYKNPDPKHTSSRSKYVEDEDDEDDIVTMMDRLNRQK